MMAERRALWKTGGAACELDVDRVVELQLFRERREPMTLGIAGETGNILEAYRAVGITGADSDHQPQIGKPCRVQTARRCGGDLGRQFSQHREIIAGLE